MDSHRIAPRVPFETNVYLEFERFSGFISEYSFNISETGMFVKSNSPMPVGTVLSFEFRLKDHFVLIQGMGEVVWSRDQSLSEERPAGMGIRFVEISPQTRELIRTMTGNVLQQGKKTFELDEPVKQVEATTKNISGLFEGMPTEAVLDSNTNELTQKEGLAGALKDDFAALFQEAPKDPQEPEFVGRVEDSQAEVKIPLGSASSMVEIDSPPELSSTPTVPVAKSKSPSRKKGIAIGLASAALLAAGAAFFMWSPNQQEEKTTRAKSPKKTIPVPSATPASEVSSTAATIPSPVPTAAISVSSTPESTLPAVVVSPIANKEATQGTDKTPTPISTVASVPTPTAIPTSSLASSAVSSSLIASEVKHISWDPQGTGWVLKVEGNGLWNKDAYTLQSIREGKPREVIKLSNIRKKYSKLSIPVNSKEISKIRVGDHTNASPPELHLVLDLQSPELALQKIESTGTILEFFFELKK